VPITVLKQNGERESFDRSKILWDCAVKKNRHSRHVRQMKSNPAARAVREVSSLEIGGIGSSTAQVAQ